MLGIGLNMNSSSSHESAVQRSSPLTDWTVTTLGGLTAPDANISGTIRSTSLGVFIDEANDWTGTLTDYNIESLVVYNVTDDVTNNQGNLKFNVNGGVLVNLHLIQRTGFDLQSLVSAASGDTIRFTFNLTLDGYNDVELVAEKTY